jgi:hypothetical protein
MKFSPLDVAIIFGGYGLAVLLLFVATRTKDTAGRLLVSAAGLAASTATVCMLTYGTFSGPWMWAWGAVPVVIAAWFWLRKYQQSSWADRLAGKTGRIFTADMPGRPSFGVLAGPGRAVGHDDPSGGFDFAVEFDFNGQRVLGMQYRDRVAAPARGVFDQTRTGQVVEAIDATHSLVQLACPPTPALLIKARALPEQRGAGGTAKASIFEDYQLARNTIGALLPSARLTPVAEGWEPEFAAQFAVEAENEAFARAVLTPEVQRLMVADPWFRIRFVAMHRGALWTNDNGSLSEWTVLSNAAHLVRLAAAIPAHTWRTVFPGYQVEQFIGRLHAQGPAAWQLPRRSLVARVNERRMAAGRVPLSPTKLVARIGLVAGLVALAVLPVVAASVSSADSGEETASLGSMAIFSAVIAIVLVKVTFFPSRKPSMFQRLMQDSSHRTARPS